MVFKFKDIVNLDYKKEDCQQGMLLGFIKYLL